MRLTTRQGVQFHFVHKGSLHQLVNGINAAAMTTLAACGDVVRNIMACPWPDDRQAVLRPLVAELVARFRPRTVGLLGAVGRRRQGRHRRTQLRGRRRGRRRAGVRVGVPAPQVQDRRRLAGRQLRRRARQRHRHRADTQRRIDRRRHRLRRVRRRRPRAEPRPAGRHLSPPRLAARLDPSLGHARTLGTGRRRRRGDRHRAARLRQPRGSPARSPQVPHRRAGHRVVPQRGRAPAGRAARRSCRAPAVDRRRAPRNAGRDHRAAGPVRQGRRPRRRASAHGPARAGRRRHRDPHPRDAAPGRLAVRHRSVTHRRGRAAPARPRRAARR